MIFALFGGDDRFVRLRRRLEASGGEVRAYALETALSDCAESAAAAVRGADCVLLPLPSEKNGLLNAPLSAAGHPVSALLGTAAPGTPVLAGLPGPETRALCRERGLPLHDYGGREDFALRNADLTAEGALSLLLEGPKALRGSRVLIAGFGRIGRSLAAKLTALGADVTVAARSAAARTAAELAGCGAVPLASAARSGWDAVVNTIPETVFDSASLAAFGDVRLIELASPPYGFDLTAAAAMGKPIAPASGLPGKLSPESAAEVLEKTIFAILEEAYGEAADRAGPDRLILHL